MTPMFTHRHLRRVAIARSLAAIALLLLALGGSAGLGGCSKPANGVSIHDLQFDPKTLTVASGTTVTWTNNDQTAHTVTSDEETSKTAPPADKFQSPILNPGGTFKHTFDTPGTYPYHCDIHPYLKGTIVVR
jgi:plastocyanin